MKSMNRNQFADVVSMSQALVMTMVLLWPWLAAGCAGNQNVGVEAGIELPEEYSSGCFGYVFFNERDVSDVSLNSNKYEILSASERELLHEQSPAAFEKLIGILEDDSPPSDEKLEAISIALSKWPDRARQVPAEWIERVSQGQDVRLGGLARTLILNGQEIDSEWIMRFLSSQATFELLAHVKIFDLGNNNLDIRAATLIAESHSGWSQNLRELSLDGNPLGSNGVEALLEVGIFSGLKYLNLGATKMGSVTLKEVLTSKQLIGLQGLALQLQPLGGFESDELREIFESLNDWDDLVSLDLAFNGLTDRWISEFSKFVFLPELKSLNLTNNHITDEGIETLLASATMDSLVELELSFNPISDRVFSILAESDAAPSIRGLGLASGQRKGARFRYDGVQAVVSEDSRFKSLDCLLLNNRRLGDEAVILLLESEITAGLVKLGLDGNGVSHRTFVELAERRVFDRLIELRSLSLDWNEIGDRGVELITQSGCCSSLVELSMRGNDIGDWGAKELVTSQTLSNLERLDLSNNVITNDTGNMLQQVVDEHKVLQELALDWQRAPD